MIDLSRRQYLLAREPSAAPRVLHIGEDCLELHGIVCRTCSEACPRAAIRFLPLHAGMARPIVDAARCDGCGACLSVCPRGELDFAGS